VFLRKYAGLRSFIHWRLRVIGASREYPLMRCVMEIDRENGVIVYPCQWSYRVIGQDRDGVREAVEAILSGREFLLFYSKGSTGGKYHSWNIDLVVRDEVERNELFALFKSHPAVVMVI